MKVGIIGAGTMGSGIAQAFAMTDGYEVCLCDIKEEYAEGGKAKIQKNMNFLVSKEKITQEKADEIMGKITTGLNNICADCDHRFSDTSGTAFHSTKLPLAKWLIAIYMFCTLSKLSFVTPTIR